MKNSLSSKLIVLFAVYCLLFTALCGCDAFVRKFSRKPQKEDLPQEEMVLVPIKYKAEVATKEELYRQYLLYWKSWQNELIESLLNNRNHKKQLDSITQVLNNLEQLKALLKEDKQRKLAAYIKQLNDLKSYIEKDPYSNDAAANRMAAERIKRNILRDFSYNKIKDNLQ